jgi:hypothetical protein
MEGHVTIAFPLSNFQQKQMGCSSMMQFFTYLLGNKLILSGSSHPGKGINQSCSSSLGMTHILDYNHKVYEFLETLANTVI